MQCELEVAVMASACKCGAGCDHAAEGGCSGEVIAVNDKPLPNHRCYAHAEKYGFEMSVTVAPEAASLFLPRDDEP